MPMYQRTTRKINRVYGWPLAIAIAQRREHNTLTPYTIGRIILLSLFNTRKLKRVHNSNVECMCRSRPFTWIDRSCVVRRSRRHNYKERGCCRGSTSSASCALQSVVCQPTIYINAAALCVVNNNNNIFFFIPLLAAGFNSIAYSVRRRIALCCTTIMMNAMHVRRT